MAARISFFDEQRVVQRTPVILLKSIFGVDPLRDITAGDVTNNLTEYTLTAGATRWNRWGLCCFRHIPRRLVIKRGQDHVAR